MVDYLEGVVYYGNSVANNIDILYLLFFQKLQQSRIPFSIAVHFELAWG